jgi:hypothetical protein
MITWIDEPTWVLVEFVELPLDSCCPHESWWRLTDWRAGKGRVFRAEGPLEFVPKLTPRYAHPTTPAMVAAWERFCLRFAHRYLPRVTTAWSPVLELTAGPS